MMLRFHAGFEAVEFEVRWLIVADERDVGFGRDLVFLTESPVAGIDEQASRAFAYQIIRSADRGAKHAALVARAPSAGLRPGDRHHRVVLRAFERRIGRI